MTGDVKAMKRKAEDSPDDGPQIDTVKRFESDKSQSSQVEERASEVSSAELNGQPSSSPPPTSCEPTPLTAEPTTEMTLSSNATVAEKVSNEQEFARKYRPKKLAILLSYSGVGYFGLQR
jgi:hypothetical protein